MPRPLRILYPNACYHVMNRGAGRQTIFENDYHRTTFINLLRECCKLYNVKIYAYCLMDNHYHLLLSTPDANLSRIMRHLNGVYTQRFNRCMKRDGALFRGRYHAKLVEEDSYRLSLTRYIHLNPVNAGIVTKPDEYRWSSYRAYLGLAKQHDWLAINIITQQLSETISLEHVKNYQDYVEVVDLDDINVSLLTKFNTPIMGSASFKEKVLKEIDCSYAEPCSADINRAKITPSIEFIMENVNSFYKIDYQTLINFKSGETNLPKLGFIYLCNKEFSHTLRNIAKIVGYQRYESVSAAVKKYEMLLEQSPHLIKEINRIAVNIREALLQKS